MVDTSFKPLRIVGETPIVSTALSTTLLFTTENNGNQSFYVTGFTVEATASTGIVTVAAGSLGTNGASYNNISAIVTFTGLTASGLHVPTPLLAASAVVPPNTGIYLKLTTAAIGTSQTIQVHVLGFYAP